MGAIKASITPTDGWGYPVTGPWLLWKGDNIYPTNEKLVIFEMSAS